MIKGHGSLGIDGLEEPFQELHSFTMTLLVENEDASPWPVSCQHVVPNQAGIQYFSKFSS